eukprot:Ihof_evm4s42 gene=Ihof_evmTU4s42
MFCKGLTALLSVPFKAPLYSLRNITTVTMPYYAVANGRTPGLYNTWEECKNQTNGYSGAKYQKFKTKEEAQRFVDGGNQGIKANVASYSIKKVAPNPVKKPEPCTFGTYNQTEYGSKVKQHQVSPDQPRWTPYSHSAPIHKPSTSSKCMEVYTDGSCLGNGKEGAAAGYGVWWGHNHSWNESERLEGPQTNQRGELKAAINAIKKAHQNNVPALKILTDSSYTIKAMTQWVPAWKQNGWKTSTGKEPLNMDLHRELYDLATSPATIITW